MQRKHIVCGLVVAALIGGVNSPVMAQISLWWSFDSVIEEARDRGTLRVGLGLFEPWSACNADGELIGFEIDVATKVAEDMGVEVEFVRTNWSYIIPSLIVEEFDVIISGMTILPERNLKVNFTSPYSAAGVYLVANTEQTADLETLADFNSSSVTIATRRGSSSMAVRKGDLDALNFFNGWIAVRQADGWLERHRRYWFEGRDWADQVATDPDTIAECDESFQ